MRRNDEDATVGEDSFLDTTANLVGILIILVVVIGAKTKVDAEAHGRKLAETQSQEHLTAPAQAVQAVQVSLRRQASEQQQYEMESQYRRSERDALLAQVQVARELVSERAENLDDEERQSLADGQQLAQLQQQLSEVQRELGAAEEYERPKIVLEHLPTPMAQTVFTREMHVQLKGGLVTVIPWERLIDALKQQVPLAARRQTNKKVLEENLGPVGGFLMRYRMLQIPGGFELERFELESTPQAPSESMETAFQTAGRLRLELASRNPADTVVTVWVYPDSFGEFRQLKSRLFDEGFLCAARPLPDDVRIGASPRGSRSTAQ
ncbi:MAG: hypothetical protein R3C53_02460 [Pirellulaceae bacterium]